MSAEFSGFGVEGGGDASVATAVSETFRAMEGGAPWRGG